MIYYLNQGWYPVEFLDDSNSDIIQAKVPISGMIEYKADIYKQGWEVIDEKRQSNLWGKVKYENTSQSNSINSNDNTDF